MTDDHAERLAELIEQLFAWTTPTNSVEKFVNLVSRMAEDGWWKRAREALAAYRASKAAAQDERLAKALEPFAALADGWEAFLRKTQPEYTDELIDESYIDEAEFIHFRRAREALAAFRASKAAAERIRELTRKP